MRIVFALWMVLALGSVAEAQDAASEARRHFEAGAAHARADRWTEALEEFRASDALLPRASTEFNVASALVRLGRDREALAVLDALDARTDLDAALRTDVGALRAAAEDAMRTLVVSVRPAETRIEIDGEVAEGEGGERSIRVDPGAHVLVASAPGRAERRLTVPADGTALALDLDALPGVLVVEPTPADAAVAVDGAAAGSGRTEREVPAGSHHVHVTAADHDALDLDVQVAAGERALVPAVLARSSTEPSLVESPILWAIVGVVVVGAAVGIGVGVATSGGQSPYGGTSGVVLASLASF